jgi:hypothetical protein
MHPADPGTPMADAADQSAQAVETSDWRKFRRGCLYFLGVTSLAWMGLEAIHVSFPYFQPGSNIVTDAKRSWSLTHPLFDDDAQIRALVFGNSKTLASFNPALFDTRVAEAGVSGKVQSINEALPGERRFVVYLNQLLSAGARPTHVLIQFPPIPEDHELNWGDWLRHDKMIVDTLFPFRTMPRDFTLFVFAAIGHGGIAGFYRESEQVAQQVVHDRGYYFLKGQSHFAGDRLPDDFRLPTDTPAKAGTRPIDTALPPFMRLSDLAKRYGFKVILFPPTYRTGELAPAPARDPVEQIVPGHPELVVLGDDYWLMPPRYFSDPVHPNVEGADIYTARLAALVAPLLKRDEN